MGLHEDLDDPPQAPMIPKQQEQESLTKAHGGAATTFAKVFNTPFRDQVPRSTSSTVGVKLLICG